MMTDLERVYNVPLRKEYRKAPKYKRAMKSVKALREFIQKHMKCQNVKIGKYANLEIHKHGRKNVPHHIKVTAKKIKDDKDNFTVFVELVGAPEEKKAEVKAKEKPKVEKEVDKAKEEKKKVLEKPDSSKGDKGPKLKNKGSVDKEEDVKDARKKIVSKINKGDPIKN